MREELDKQLCEECPNLFIDRHASMAETCMCWGFPADGWFNLIRELSLKLEALICALPEEERKDYRAVQVKEKFGTLRFYMTAETAEMSDLIFKAEEKSATICEYCGDCGILRRNRGWWLTLCDNCNKDGKK